ncbi:hypothetical protein GCM10008917_28680 [Paraclostridium tenue]|uniref:Uncharacterized protein n=1 Tax=Paraclostridium tenue TaxID=1737 RepID=A0ABP3XQ06_9FIRM
MYVLVKICLDKSFDILNSNFMKMRSKLDAHYCQNYFKDN